MNLAWVGDLWSWFNAARVASLGAVVAAVAAVAALQRSMRDSRSRSRPMVGAELVADRYADGIAHLVVRNFGPSVARNVRVTFDPPLAALDGLDEERSSIPFIARRYANPIATLVPGAELRNIYWDGDEDAPRVLTVKIQCESADGSWFRRPDRYMDWFILDVGVLESGTSVTSSAAPEEVLKNIAGSLRSIAKHADLMARA